MSNILTIKAAEGRRVRDPATAAVIPSDGLTVIWSSHWERRLKDGDIEVVPAAPPPAPAPAKKDA